MPRGSLRFDGSEPLGSADVWQRGRPPSLTHPLLALCGCGQGAEVVGADAEAGVEVSGPAGTEAPAFLEQQFHQEATVDLVLAVGSVDRSST